MKKYYNYNDTPVLFEGTVKEHKKFITKNGHLVGSECTKEEYNASYSEEGKREKRYKKRKKILQIANHDEQFKILFNAFEYMKANGVDVTQEVSDFLDKRANIKDN